jgi:hypothetical protein
MTLYKGLEERCDRVNRNDKSEECGSRREAVGENVNTVKNNAGIKKCCLY